MGIEIIGTEIKKNIKEGDSVITKECFEVFGNVLANAGDVFEVSEIALDYVCIISDDIEIEIDFQTFSKYFEKVEEVEEAPYSAEDYLPNKVTEEMVDSILKDADIAVDTLFDRCTVVTCKLPCGFVITETSACVDPENYDVDTGIDICIDKIVSKVYELEAYRLMNDIYNAKKTDMWSNCESTDDCDDCPYVSECFEEEEHVSEEDECAACEGKYVCYESPYRLM